jgi:hypothetical protein
MQLKAQSDVSKVHHTEQVSVVVTFLTFMQRISRSYLGYPILPDTFRSFPQSLHVNATSTSFKFLTYSPWLSSYLTYCYAKSAVGKESLALGYGLDDRGYRVRFPAGAGNCSLHHRVQNGSGAHPASYPMSTRGSFPVGKAAGAWSWPLTSI